METIVENAAFFDPDHFVIEAKKKLGIESDIEFIFDDKVKDSGNCTDFSGDKPVVTIGIQGYALKALTNHQKEKLCNTIYHELVHVRDRAQVKGVIPESEMNSRSLAHFGFMILDEYIAYREANLEYPENEGDLKSDMEKVLYALFSHMTKGPLYINPSIPFRTEADNNEFFIFFYNCCSAVIVHYIIRGSFPNEKEYEPLKRAINILDSYSTRRGELTFADYESLGKSFVESLIYDLPSAKRASFWFNTALIK